MKKCGGIQNYCLEKQLLIEELVVQNEIMNTLHRDSINTIRIMTYKGKPITAILRMGVGNSNIDNASSGGIYAEVDINEGVVISLAMDYKGDEYIYHPTTRVIILGFKIPMWEKCLEFVADTPLVGWDIAVGLNEPILIEVNERPDPFLKQSPRKIGIKSLIK